MNGITVDIFRPISVKLHNLHFDRFKVLFIIKLSKILRISRSLLFSRNKKIFFRRVGKGINAIKNGIREKNKVLLVTTITLSNASKQASK